MLPFVIHLRSYITRGQGPGFDLLSLKCHHQSLLALSDLLQHWPSVCIYGREKKSGSLELLLDPAYCLIYALLYSLLEEEWARN